MPDKLLKKITLPKGFKFKITVHNKRSAKNHEAYINCVNIELYDTRRTECRYHDPDCPIGSVELVRRNYSSGENSPNNVFETHSSLDKEYHNKGLGALMYARAIQWCLANGYGVRSSCAPSAMAFNVWEGQTLRKHFRICYKKLEYDNVYYAYRKRTVLK